MTDELTELRHKLDEVERKTAIWRSQVMVLVLVFVAGWIVSAIWARVSGERRAATIESRLSKVEAGASKMPKVVEAQAFVLRTEDGRELASLKKLGDSAQLVLRGDRKAFELHLRDDGLNILDARPETAGHLKSGEAIQFHIASFTGDKDGRLTLYGQKGVLAAVPPTTKALAP